MLERPPFLLFGLLPVLMIDSVNLMVFLLFLLQGLLALSVKESGSGHTGLDALIGYHQQIGHDFCFLVLDVGNIIPSIAKMFHIIMKSFITLLLDSFYGFSGR
jgi:hypothetical protein